jgi:tRNA 2-thiouridine synthesizing protein E
MPTFSQGEVSIEVDEDGFMAEPDKWNEMVAAAIATTEGVEGLSEEHWKVVNYLRDYYLKFGVAPMIRKLCKETGFKLNKIYELFPSGPAKGACKVAGLPKPAASRVHRPVGGRGPAVMRERFSCPARSWLSKAPPRGQRVR